MIKTTPFHPRLAELNTTGLWGHWSSYLSAPRYDTSAEARVLRDPQQRRVLRHLAAVQVLDPRQRRREVPRRRACPRHPPCRPGQAQYTVWCDDRGYVLEDGVVFRHSATRVLPDRGRAERRLLLRPDRPAGRRDRGRHRRLRRARRAGPALARDPGCAPEDVEKLRSSSTARPRSARRPSPSRAPATPATSATRSSSQPRTPSRSSTPSSRPAIRYGMRPFGEEALLMSRIEAGLVLINVEFHSSRYAYTDHERVTPSELGFGWMLKSIDDDRPVRSSAATRSAARSATRPRAGRPSGCRSTGSTGTGSTTRPA